jgi:tripartite ATP-independent transporter DctP family solute receptor
MRHSSNRRTLVQSLAALVATGALPASWAQAAKIGLIFSETMTDQDVRAKLLVEKYGPALGPDFDFKPYFGATLFKQGTEIVAMQRGNLDMGALSVSDIQRQIPEWGIVGAPYVFRDLAHMQKTFASDIGKELFKMSEDKLGIKMLAVWYIGTRHVSLRTKKKVNTPADLAGVKLRMPAGEGWQFIGSALGANPVPVAFTEVYTALQTGAIDAQDNPMPLTRTMKFQEVLSQYVLTGHLVNFNILSIRKAKWDAMTPAQQQRLQAASTEVANAITAQMVKEEAELVDFFKSAGLDVYTPDRTAFRNHAIDMIKKSKFIGEWKPGMLDAINAM